MSNTIPKAELLSLLDGLVRRIETTNKIYDQLKALTELSPESRLGTEIFAWIDPYVELLNRYVGCDQTWIPWYIWDNDCGKNGLMASDGSRKLKSISTTADLAKLLLNTKKRSK
jgi:hypothetical protein